jgi:hypothetical protein
VYRKHVSAHLFHNTLLLEAEREDWETCRPTTECTGTGHALLHTHVHHIQTDLRKETQEITCTCTHIHTHTNTHTERERGRERERERGGGREGEAGSEEDCHMLVSAQTFFPSRQGVGDNRRNTTNCPSRVLILALHKCHAIAVHWLL